MSMLKINYLEPLKLPVTSLASSLGVSRKTLSNIINERAGISPDMACCISNTISLDSKGCNPLVLGEVRSRACKSHPPAGFWAEPQNNKVFTVTVILTTPSRLRWRAAGG